MLGAGTLEINPSLHAELKLAMHLAVGKCSCTQNPQINMDCRSPTLHRGSLAMLLRAKLQEICPSSVNANDQRLLKSQPTLTQASMHTIQSCTPPPPLFRGQLPNNTDYAIDHVIAMSMPCHCDLLKAVRTAVRAGSGLCETPSPWALPQFVPALVQGINAC